MLAPILREKDSSSPHCFGWKGIKASSQTGPLHVPLGPRPLTWHLRVLRWISAAAVRLGSAWNRLHQAPLLTPAEGREARFRWAQGWRWHGEPVGASIGWSAAGTSGRAGVRGGGTLTLCGAGSGPWGRRCSESGLPYRAHSFCSPLRLHLAREEQGQLG